MSPRTVQLLVRLYPRRWRQRYAAEYAELLGATAATLPALVDVVRHAAAEHIHEHDRAWRGVTAIAAFAVLDALAVHARITDNLLWAPTTPVRAAALALTLAPLVVVVVLAASAVRARHTVE